MKKQLLATLIAFSMLAFATPSLAATVTQKRQLIIPRISASILPTEARNRPQELVQEFECGDTTYRYWVIPVDQIFPEHEGYDIFEVRRGNTTKYKTLKYKFGLYYGRHYRYVACASDGVYVTDDRYHPRSTMGETSTIRVPYTTFQSDHVWNFEAGIQRSYVDGSNGTYWYNRAYRPVSVDGIVQLPGTLTLASNGIFGDSRPATIESSGNIIIHTLPWYRNLNEVPKKPVGITLRAEFYRLTDGYGVKETMLNCGSDSPSKSACTEEGVTFYRIRNGESAYSIVTSLPFQSLLKDSYLTQGVYGAVLSRMSDYKEYALIHRLPEINEVSGYSYYVSGSVLAENQSSVYVRYMLTPTRTGTKQYWEATIQK